MRESETEIVRERERERDRKRERERERESSNIIKHFLMMEMHIPGKSCILDA